MTIMYQGTQDTLTIFVNGQPTILRAGTVQYNQAKKAILEDRLADVPSLLTAGGAIAKYLGQDYRVDGEKISFRGSELPEALSERILAMGAEGLDPSRLLRFYERLDQNPSFQSRTELFDFIKHCDIAIEPDGMILGYKKVNDDYTDCHSGTFSNTPGMVHEMPRNRVNDNREQTCSYGFHVGSLEYARDHFHAGSGNIVICRVDPKDVVSVPTDYNGQKLRTCKYEVVGEWNGDQALDMHDEVDLDDEYEDEVDELDEALATFVHDEGDPPDAIFTEVSAAGLDALRTTRELMEQSIDALRKYATHTLRIVGASKISGGKTKLVAKIMRVRKNRGL